MQALFDTAPPAPCPAPFNLAAYVLAAAADHPDKIALQIVGAQGAERRSYRWLAAAVRGVGAGLLAAGLSPGDRLLMRLGNGIEFPLLFLGAIAVGVIPVPSPAELTTPEITRLAARVAPRALAAAPGLALPEPLAGAAPWPVIEAAQILAWAEGPGVDFALGDPARPAYILFTSGSSGRPQAVVQAHRAIWARRMMWQGWYGLTPEDRLLHAGAMNWSFTLGTGLLDPWSCGATALVPAPGTDIAQLPLLLRRYDATLFAAAPGVYRRLLRAHPELDLPRLRHGLSAGEKMAPALIEAWRQATGRPIHEALGMTECSTFISGAPDRPAPPGAIGYPQPGRRVAVLDPAGRIVARGKSGLLAVSHRDPGLFPAYLDDPDARASRQRGEWFVTGDRVVMAADGAITYLGRDDNMMNAGGFRVSPAEVEAVMDAHPAISECAACEVAVRPGVTVIACFYVGESVPVAELAAFAQTHLARYKRPRLFLRRSELPRGTNGKLLRRQLRLEPGETDDKT